MMDAVEAERAGLVSRVVPADKLLDEALAAAATIAGYSLPAVMMIKESINRAFEIRAGRRPAVRAPVFHSLSPSTTRRKAWPPSSKSARSN
jgi:enoyl-CoA hydratase